MTPQRIRYALGAMAVVLGSWAWAAAGVAAEIGMAERLVALAETGSHGELESLLDRWLDDSALTAETRERALYGFLVGVRKLAPEQIPVDIVARFSDYRARALVPHPESGGALLVPRYDVAGAALGTLHWRERALRSAAVIEALRADPEGFWSLVNEKSGADARALLEALESVEPELLTATRSALDKSLHDRDDLLPAAAVVARRLRDVEMASRVIAKADPLTARRLLASARVFGDAGGFDLIREAAGRRALASEAMATAARLASESPKVRAWLIDRLDDPEQGASAAAALAALGDTAIDARIIGELEASRSEAELRHRLLYLHLADTPRTRKALARFTQDPAFPTPLREEVRRWQ